MVEKAPDSYKKIRVCFSKGKFLGLPLQQQHKKCGAILRILYDTALVGEENRELFDHYNEIQGWMGEPYLEQVKLKLTADRYHEHLQKANLCLREHNLLPNITQKDKDHAEDPWPICVYLENLRSAYNVGSILRTAEGMQFETVYFGNRTPFIDHNQVKQSSMGAYEWIPCKKVDGLKELPGPLIVMETSPDAIPIHEFIFPNRFTLVMGNEEYGCSDEILSACDHLITIPMRGRKNSLNVANAFSMAACEILRQRQGIVL